jgi:hypothetical protein
MTSIISLPSFSPHVSPTEVFTSNRKIALLLLFTLIYILILGISISSVIYGYTRYTNDNNSYQGVNCTVISCSSTISTCSKFRSSFACVIVYMQYSYQALTRNDSLYNFPSPCPAQGSLISCYYSIDMNDISIGYPDVSGGYLAMFIVFIIFIIAVLLPGLFVLLYYYHKLLSGNVSHTGREY